MRLGRLLFSALMLTLMARPASAAWLEAESDHFIVYSKGSEADLREQVRLLEDFDQLLRGLTGAPKEAPANKLSIYLVHENNGLRKVINAGDGYAGFYLATPEGTAAFALARERIHYDIGDVVFHEYAHHFMMQNFPGNYPSWYVEGFAEYLATADFGDTYVDVGRYERNLASWLRGEWFTLDRMLRSDTDWVGGTQFYAQSWLMVHYLMRDPGRRNALQAYLKAFSAGQDPNDAFRTVFGKSAAAFTRELRSYGNDMTFTRIPRASGGSPPAIKVRSLPPAADDLILFSAGLELGLTDWGSYSLLPRVREAAEDHEGDPMALEALIRAELLYGDRKRAESLLDSLLKLRPGDRDALYLRGLAHIFAGRDDAANRAQHFEKARPWLARAHKADPNFYPALVRYAESFSVDAGYASENVGNILLLATQLAPQVGLIRLNAAQQQAMMGDFDTARGLLAPVVNYAHSKRIRETARALMSEVQAGKRPGLAFHVERIAKDD